MKKETAQPKAAYEKPSIEVLGKFAGLTLGNKSNPLGDLSHGLSSHIGS